MDLHAQALPFATSIALGKLLLWASFSPSQKWKQWQCLPQRLTVRIKELKYIQCFKPHSTYGCSRIVIYDDGDYFSVLTYEPQWSGAVFLILASHGTLCHMVGPQKSKQINNAINCIYCHGLSSYGYLSGRGWGGSPSERGRPLPVPQSSLVGSWVLLTKWSSKATLFCFMKVLAHELSSEDVPLTFFKYMSLFVAQKFLWRPQATNLTFQKENYHSDTHSDMVF